MYVFITGVSGVGKTTVMEELLRRGFVAYDTDHNGLSDWRGRKDGTSVDESLGLAYGTQEWFDTYIWTLLPEKVLSLRPEGADDITFMCGAPGNAEDVSSNFDIIICLYSDDEVLKGRVLSREARYDGELKDILNWNEDFTERFRKLGAVMIDASANTERIVDSILKVIKD